MHGQEAVVQLLLQRGARASIWAAHRAAAVGDVQLLQALADNGWEVDTPGLVGCVPSWLPGLKGAYLL